MKSAPSLTASDVTNASPIARSLQTIWLLCVLVFLVNYTFEILDLNHLYQTRHFLLALLQLSFSVWALIEVVLLERRQTAIPLRALRLTLLVQLLLGASRFPLGRLMHLGQAHLGHFPSHLDLGLAVVYVPLYLLVFLLISKLLINAFSLLERQSALRLQSEIATRRSTEAALDRSNQARQQVEGEVRDLRAQLERVAFELTENIPVGTYTMVLRPGDPLGKFSFMSRRFLELTGLDRELASSDPLKAFACVHPDDYAAWVKLNAQAFATKQRFFGETRIIVAGEVRWITAESIPRDL
ncbi:MAG TPA: PAS domain-containing protein, partial [Chromatiaceae bacterium]|nr:PAS domain-containing protein [Chromatiaceae bacterium]